MCVQVPPKCKRKNARRNDGRGTKVAPILQEMGYVRQ